VNRCLNACRRIYLAQHRTIFDAEVAAFFKSNPPPLFKQYFSSYWLGKKNERAVKWAVCYRTSADPLLNTNNWAEASHRSLKRLVPALNMSIIELLPWLKNQLDFAAKEAARIISGRVPPKVPKTLSLTKKVTASVNSIDAARVVCNKLRTAKPTDKPIIPASITTIVAAVAPVDGANHHLPPVPKTKKKKNKSKNKKG